jgi:hypothetical protein
MNLNVSSSFGEAEPGAPIAIDGGGSVTLSTGWQYFSKPLSREGVQLD